ncbi:MAG: ABC transporter ATP-binding protein [Candidatus Sumerlaeia bacterium]|nr:ABC transporter ATP-binding protein [Candidatus Sumerlaeia bacterium]
MSDADRVAGEGTHVVPTKREELQFVRELLHGRWRHIILVHVFLFFQHSPVFMMPILGGLMLDLVVDGGESRLKWLVFYTSISLVLLIQNIPSCVLRQRYLSLVTRGMGRDLRVRICTQLQRLSLHYHNNTSVGKLQTKALRDVEQVELVPGLMANNVFLFAAQCVITVIAVLFRAPGALVFFIVLVPLAVAIQRVFGRRIGDTVHQYRRSLEGMTSRLSDMLTMIPVTRAHGVEEEEIRAVSSKMDRVFNEGFRFDRIIAVFGASSWVVMQAVQALFLGGAVYAAFQGWLTVGDVLMFNAFFIGLSNALNTLLNTLPQFAQARESLRSIQEVLRSPDIEDYRDKKQVDTPAGHFRFEKVTFVYPRSERHALKNVDLDIPAGSSIALVGGSGSGKSTLISLVLGFIRPTGGRLLLDGRDLAGLDLRSLRRHVGVVTQDTVFFSGTIYENINFGLREANEERASRALRLANAWEFVAELPDGIHTRLGEDGIKLSGGQRQRLAIARALIRNPRVLILDEATSALDVESEELVQNALNRVMRNRTTFMVSHRLATVRHADRIVILERGHITHMGSHGELMEGDNFYSSAVRRNLRFWG